MSDRFSVFPYSSTKLLELLAEIAKTTQDSVADRPHSAYFETYFKTLKARTIVVERNYIDRYYLEDFAGYLVKCFQPYDRECTRLHFFKNPFTDVEFNNWLSGDHQALKAAKLQSAYLGFIVVKPLPETKIGRTCLVTYPERKRHFPITRYYDVSLCGIRLKVRTLAFQEQDRVASACATSALWSVFQGTGLLFQHAIPSPVEITNAATSSLPSMGRTLPNKGLSINQMAQAIRNVQLEPALVDVSDNKHNQHILKSTIYAYLKGRIPVLLIGGLFNTVSKRIPYSHAVAVTGYRQSNPQPIACKPTGFLLSASRINQIYAHDDQVGPFARMVFEEDGISLEGSSETMDCLTTSWGDSAEVHGKYKFVPQCLLVPLASTIRIPFGNIHDLILQFDALFELYRLGVPQRPEILNHRTEWDIYLSTINDFKEEILIAEGIDEDLRKEVLCARLPLFIWRVTARHGQRLLLDFLFDATDIEQGELLLRIVPYNSLFFALVKALAKVFHSDPASKSLEGESQKLWSRLAED